MTCARSMFRRAICTAAACATGIAADAGAQQTRRAVLEPFTGPDSLLILPTPGPKTRKPVVFPDIPNPGGPPTVIVVAAVVGTNGRIVSGSAVLLQNDDPSRARALCNVLHRQRFDPVKLNGVARRALVISPYVFYESKTASDRPLPPDLSRWRSMTRDEFLQTVLAAPPCVMKS